MHEGGGKSLASLRVLLIMETISWEVQLMSAANPGMLAAWNSKITSWFHLHSFVPTSLYFDLKSPLLLGAEVTNNPSCKGIYTSGIHRYPYILYALTNTDVHTIKNIKHLLLNWGIRQILGNCLLSLLALQPKLPPVPQHVSSYVHHIVLCAKEPDWYLGTPWFAATPFSSDPNYIVDKRISIST